MEGDGGCIVVRMLGEREGFEGGLFLSGLE